MLSSDVIVFSCRHRNGTIKERTIHERRISQMGLLTVIAKKHWDKIGQQIAALWLLQDSNGHDMTQGII